MDIPKTIDASFVGANYALRAWHVSHLLKNGIDLHVYGPNWLPNKKIIHSHRLKRIKYIVDAIFQRYMHEKHKASANLANLDLWRSLLHRYPDNFHPAVSDQELIELYSSSHISLGFLEVYEGHDRTSVTKQHLHLREFEAPMCGALYCTGYSDELAEMFEPDKEVIVYKNEHELIDKVSYYLKKPAEAEAIRLAGYKRAITEHTYHLRYINLFKELAY